MEQVDVGRILSQLKDFQRDTVHYAFRRMYLDGDVTRRFLIADEVGLGKTLVARGIIARVIDHLWETGKRIDIVYICSNANIARQNIRRLNVMANENFSLPDRITLLPIHLQDLTNNRVNFVSLTPGTSLDLKSSMGTYRERALLYHLLKKQWSLDGKEAIQIFQGTSQYENFRSTVETFGAWHQIDSDLARRFCEAVTEQDEVAVSNGRWTLTSRYRSLHVDMEPIPIDGVMPDTVKLARTSLIGELRKLLADACIHALEPDLIILDEFQRFKHLLSDEGEISELAHKLFNYAEGESKTRVLLLSATPYKMYTVTADQEDAEDHYADLKATMRFLYSNDLSKEDDFIAAVDGYRREMLRINGEIHHELMAAKANLEQGLREVMCRTERLAVTENRDGMLVHMNAENNRLSKRDLSSYLALQKIARIIDHQDTLEYWQSAPYLLSFMDPGYQFKTRLSAAYDNGAAQEVGEVVSQSPEVLLRREAVMRYEVVDPDNARMRSLYASTIDKGLWQLLWLPPSLPYYELGEPFASPQREGVTKRLIFSNWRVVPKAIATLLSYEAERRIAEKNEESLGYSSDDRNGRSGLLRFTHRDKRPERMSSLTLVYPSTALARCSGAADPLLYFNSGSGETTPLLKVRDLLAKIEYKIQKLFIPRLRRHVANTSGRSDESWYWAAPILLDNQIFPESTKAWLEQPELAQHWSGEGEVNAQDGESTAWAQHVLLARELAQGRHQLGPMPDDLASVLALVALASPANVALRSLLRMTSNPSTTNIESIQIHKSLRNAAGRIGYAFLSLFNSPDSTTLLRSQRMADMLDDAPDTPYWRRVLRYCAAGCLQAVMDEYMHMARESLGFIDGGNVAELSARVSEHIASVLKIRTATPTVDEISTPASSSASALSSFQMRNRFAMRFGNERSDDGKGEIRAEAVRDAFNSPFWPFVLATTSVGQEGLDFHTYCHAVIHWNLPSNPVDLEQREGRVHRYKGHAVRKNIAHTYAHKLDAGGLDVDLWGRLFDKAREEAANDLIPYWTYTSSPDEIANSSPARIERYVPAQPLSRDAARYNDLKKSLVLYRMVFGQPRQEDLLAYLAKTGDMNGNSAALAELLRINLEPPEIKETS